jgi:uncharacterized protein (TIGR00369 family)
MSTLPPSADRLRLDAEAVNRLLLELFPLADRAGFGVVEKLRPGGLTLSCAYGEHNLRPGGVVAGPALMAMADHAVYALVLCHIGPVPMAVTTSLTMHFLRPARPGRLEADVRLLRLGRRIATCEVLIHGGSAEAPYAQATVAYAIPDGVT